MMTAEEYSEMLTPEARERLATYMARLRAKREDDERREARLQEQRRVEYNRSLNPNAGKPATTRPYSW